MIRMESSINTLNQKSRLKQAQIMSVESLLSINLSIPDYQRPYAWGEIECQTLWDDIFSFAFPEMKEKNTVLFGIGLGR